MELKSKQTNSWTRRLLLWTYNVKDWLYAKQRALDFVLSKFVFQLHINLLLSKKIYYTSTILELDITYTYPYPFLPIHNDYSWLHHY